MSLASCILSNVVLDIVSYFRPMVHFSYFLLLFNLKLFVSCCCFIDFVVCLLLQNCYLRNLFFRNVLQFLLCSFYKLVGAVSQHIVYVCFFSLVSVVFIDGFFNDALSVFPSVLNVFTALTSIAMLLIVLLGYPRRESLHHLDSLPLLSLSLLVVIHYTRCLVLVVFLNLCFRWLKKITIIFWIG